MIFQIKFKHISKKKNTFWLLIMLIVYSREMGKNIMWTLTDNQDKENIVKRFLFFYNKFKNRFGFFRFGMFF